MSRGKNADLLHEDDTRHNYLIFYHFPNYSSHFISYMCRQENIIQRKKVESVENGSQCCLLLPSSNECLKSKKSVIQLKYSKQQMIQMTNLIICTVMC